MLHGSHAAHKDGKRASEETETLEEAQLENAEPHYEGHGVDGVVYPDGSSLLRPQRPTKAVVAVAGVAVVIAAVLGGMLLTSFIDNVLHAAEREQEAAQANIVRDVAYDLPVVADYMALDNASISTAFTGLGYTIFQVPSAGSSDEGSDVFKFPSDVTLAEGGLLYAQGISNLSASDAARILTGSWRFTIERGAQTSMRVRYVDFQSGTLEAALAAGMSSQGYDQTMVSESGTDDSGNLYCTGSQMLADGSEATWRVSVIELEHVYDIKGLPSNAVYVGIRVTQ